MHDTQDIIDTAHALADAARATVLPYFRAAGLEADNKLSDGKFDPVTEADRAAERVMRDLLAKRRPHDAIHGEEYGHSSGTSGLTWVLDPIDGTRSFLSGSPTWGVLVAVSDADGPIFGIIDQPYIGERFEGGFGQSRVTGPQGQHPLGVRAARPMEQSILFTTFPEIGTEQENAGFKVVSNAVKLTRYGIDCYAYALIAAGQIDLVIEAGLHPYDIQAPIAVIEAAGGIVTDWDGQPVHQGGRVIAAASRAQHDAALALLAPFV